MENLVDFPELTLGDSTNNRYQPVTSALGNPVLSSDHRHLWSQVYNPRHMQTHIIIKKNKSKNKNKLNMIGKVFLWYLHPMNSVGTQN